MKPALYDYWRSSASYRVRIALGLADLEFATRTVDLVKGEQKGPDHLQRNPQGLVPTLEIDGQVFSQSLAIIEYLDETRPFRFLPPEPAARARVRTLSHAIAMEIHPVCNVPVARHAAILAGNSARDAVESPAYVEWMVHFMSRGLVAFEALLDDPATGRFCHGSSPTMADVCLLPQIYNARRRGVSLASLPNISRIVGELEGVEAFARAHPDNFKGSN